MSFFFIRKYFLILSRNSFPLSVFVQHLLCSTHNSALREYRVSRGIIYSKRKRVPESSFLLSNMVISAFWVSVFIVSFAIFTCVPVGIPCVIGLEWFYLLSDSLPFTSLLLASTWSIVSSPSTAATLTVPCPKERHDLISCYCLVSFV